MKSFFETLFIAAVLAFVGWGTINVGMKFEVKIKGEAWGFTVGGMSEREREALTHITFRNTVKDSVITVAGLYERADSAFLVEKFFPTLEHYYDTIRLYKLKPNTTYTVTGGIFIIYYQGLNFEPHNTFFAYNDSPDEDSLFYQRMKFVRSHND